ncbi:HNH endonuclease signature motif containing protein [Mycobacterium paragordonae]|uniref:HNH endonuclease signature motif containing protein n=1 Tax=Mycobacterium paragordonae TaxID=1389713 RepID=UPI0009F62831
MWRNALSAPGTSVQRPCLGCGCLIASGSRCQECRPKRRPASGRKGRTATDWRWRNLSQRLRKLSPFCERCGSREDLTVDHVIPISDPVGAELVYDELNLRVLCRRCNAERGYRCTQAERRQVLQAIRRRRPRSRLISPERDARAG